LATGRAIGPAKASSIDYAAAATGERRFET
jgi:hypothetical protein